MKKISIVVPCYNEESVIELFYKEITKVSKEMNCCDFEYIFVDDGSKDRTLEIAKELSLADNRVKYISFSRNFGKEAAMYAGLKAAEGDYVAIMDADLQDPPSLLPEMYQHITEEDYDCVGTRRVTRKGEPPIRSFFARMFYTLINKISEIELVDGARDYRLMTRKYVDSILRLSERNRFSKGLFAWVGFKTKWLEFENIERAAGETKWSFWKLFKYSIEGIVSFSTAPLFISSILGIVMCLVAFVAMIFIFFRQLIFEDSVAGWASQACITIMLGGLVLLFIGILGLYLSKIYVEIKNRPIFISREDNIEKDMNKD